MIRDLIARARALSSILAGTAADVLRLFQIFRFWVDSSVTGAAAQPVQPAQPRRAWDAVRRY